MNEAGNLAGRLAEQMPRDLLDFIKKAGELSQQRRQSSYLVGGAARDLLLERCTLDIDIAVEGDAIALAREMAQINQARLTVHTRFGTASLQWRDRRADLATARAETYAHPGALPVVRPGSLTADLARRDFTINAMAIALDPPRFGELIDPEGGRHDIARKLVRVLHEKSFTDDATRIWRAVRYEQRLGFDIEPVTLGLIKRDIDRMSTVSGDRIRHELELVLKEEAPEKILARADKLGVLYRIHPALKADDWLTETFATAGERHLNNAPPLHLYLALLFYRLGPAELEKVIGYLRLPNTAARALRDTAAIKARIKELSVPGLAPSAIYELLQGCGLTALEASALAIPSETAAEHIALYRDVLRRVNPALTGADLKSLGVPEGPEVKAILRRLREARLDGRISNRQEEAALVKGWIK